MNIFKKIPLSPDYILGILMVVIGIILLYDYWDILIYPLLLKELVFDFMPDLTLLIGGIILLAFPRKNMRRTIWLCGLILGLNFLLTGIQYMQTYMDFRDYSITLVTYVVSIFSFGVIYIGCSVAMILNSVVFLSGRTRSIYPMVIAIILAFTIDYFDAEISYSIVVIDSDIYLMSDFIQTIFLSYLPHMLLLVLFTLLFMSDEVSWYTAKGGMRRALNRLKTTGPVLGIDTLSRSQLILLLQCGYDFGTVLTQGEYQCRLEVYHDGEKRTLVFFRAGEDSLAGARYVNLTSIVTQGSVSDCGYAELYGEDGFYMRFRVVDSVGKKTKRSRSKFQLATGRMPDFRLSIANCALKDLVEATGRYPLYAPRSRGSFEIEISDNDGTRQVEFIRDGSTLEKFDLVSAVPVCEFGEYTKFIIYGNMGRTVALKVLPYSFNRIAEKKKRE